jgi:hypothetical protein
MNCRFNAMILSLILSVALLPLSGQAQAVDNDFLVDYISGLVGSSTPVDLNGDGEVDYLDMFAIAHGWRQDVTVFTPVATDTPTLTPTYTATVTQLSTDTPINTDTPTPTSTDTPTPTDTPGGGDTYPILDYFVLSQGSTWTYTGVNSASFTSGSGSTDDDFTWTVLSASKTISATVEANIIKTDAKEATDDRNLDEDFWWVDSENNLYFYGFYNGQQDDVVVAVPFPPFSITAQFIVQNVILSEPLLLGTAQSQIGDIHVTQTSTQVTIKLKETAQEIPVPMTLTMTVKHESFVSSISTPMGNFTDVLRLEIGITGTATYQGNEIDFPIREPSAMFLKRNVGMVVQDQSPDPNDAEVQGIESGTVGGTAVTPH